MTGGPRASARRRKGRVNRAARLLALAGVLVLGPGACRRKEPPAPKLPTPPPTSPPVTVVLSPTATLPANMELSAKVDPAIERTLTASAPRTPAGVGESSIDRT